MTDKQIIIKYDGEYPCLCLGHLEVWVDGKYYDFGKYVLSSGGGVSFDEDWNENVWSGEWSFSCCAEFPKNFPMELTDELLKVINEEIPWGCCGGCV